MKNQSEAGKELAGVTTESPRPAPKRSVNPNAVWDLSRCDDLSTLEHLVREVCTINSGSHCLERIARCVELAETLQATSYERGARFSFLQFLNQLAIDDRFGSDNAPERDAETLPETKEE